MTTDTDQSTERAEYTEQIEQRIKDTLREFQDLELEQMRKGEIKARARLAKVKRGVDQKRTAAQESLHRTRKASEAAWHEARVGLEAAWGELREAVERARSELSGDEADGESNIGGESGGEGAR
jgi:hypothetical protein